MRTWRDSTLRLRAEARETLEATLKAISTGEEAAAHADGRARCLDHGGRLKVWAYLLGKSCGRGKGACCMSLLSCFIVPLGSSQTSRFKETK